MLVRSKSFFKTDDKQYFRANVLYNVEDVVKHNDQKFYRLRRANAVGKPRFINEFEFRRYFTIAS